MRLAKDGCAFTFVEGALTQAVRCGHWLLLDEINLGPPEVGSSQLHASGTKPGSGACLLSTLSLLRACLEQSAMRLCAAFCCTRMPCCPSFSALQQGRAGCWQSILCSNFLPALVSIAGLLERSCGSLTLAGLTPAGHPQTAFKR